MAAVPRIALADLLSPCSIVTSAYSTAAEQLAVGWARTGLVVVSLPPTGSLEAGLEALLGRNTRVLPGCESREWRVGSAPEVAAIEEAYGAMESFARTLLAALCRSSLLRLRADAFSPMLDDLPLSRSAHGSSVLAAKKYVDNFTSLTAVEHSVVLPLFADPQEEVSERGLLSVIYAQEATSAEGTALSAMQARDSGGRWVDVQLAHNEVAVLLGHTLQHATAGLLRPATHRVVGQPFGAPGGGAGLWGAGHGRRLLHFELRPRPAAVLDLRAQLAVSGHQVSARFSPVSVASLMQKFESLLSPAAKLATPGQQEGAAAHAAWEALQAAAAQKQNKKRASAVAGDLPATGRPLTRSGSARLLSKAAANTRRTSAGFSGRQQEQQAPAAAAGEAQQQQCAGEMEWGDGPSGGIAGGRYRSSAGSRGSFSLASRGTGGSSAGGGDVTGWRTSLEPAGSGALYVRGGRTCAVVDGCLRDDPAECLTLCVSSFTGLQRWFYVNASCNLGRVFELYCQRMGIGLGAVKFLFRGERVYGASTPVALKMRDGAEVTAVPERSDRLQHARELGPLYASVFGAAAAAAVPASQPL